MVATVWALLVATVYKKKNVTVSPRASKNKQERERIKKELRLELPKIA